jgi:hypothetical protein
MNRYAFVPRGSSFARVTHFHKLSLGTSVTLFNAPRDPRSKDPKQSNLFEITGLLPVDGAFYQYRVKDLATGRERVVSEDQISSSA